MIPRLAILIRAGGFDGFGQPRTRQFWEAQQLQKNTSHSKNLEFDFDREVDPVSDFFREHSSLLREPTRREQLEAETELFGFAVSGHPLELFADIAWHT